MWIGCCFLGYKSVCNISVHVFIARSTHLTDFVLAYLAVLLILIDLIFFFFPTATLDNDDSVIVFVIVLVAARNDDDGVLWSAPPNLM